MPPKTLSEFRSSCPTLGPTLVPGAPGVPGGGQRQWAPQGVDPPSLLQSPQSPLRQSCEEAVEGVDEPAWHNTFIDFHGKYSSEGDNLLRDFARVMHR